jgi:hypothetical protein
VRSSQSLPRTVVTYLGVVKMASRSEFKASMRSIQEDYPAINQVPSNQKANQERPPNKAGMYKCLPFFAIRSQLPPGDGVQSAVTALNRPDVQNLTLTAAKTVSDLNPYISSFASNSRVVMDFLKQLGTIHPCIQGASAPFCHTIATQPCAKPLSWSSMPPSHSNSPATRTIRRSSL